MPLLKVLWRFDLGNLGVRIFFVISGFLITAILLKEDSTSGSIGLRRFYARRLLRIGPAYYVFLAAMALAGGFAIVEVKPHDFLPPLTYTTNYFATTFVLGHTWSLSVEEQFYLLWPGALFVLGRRRAFTLAAVLIVFAPFARLLCVHYPELFGSPRYAFPAVSDALACGCFLALLRERLQKSRAYRGLLGSRWFVVVPGAIVLAQCAPAAAKDLFLYTLINILIAVSIDRVTRFPSSWSGRVLNAKPMVLVGTLSYSLYLWQQPFLDPASALVFPVNVVALVVIALASYQLVEKPALAWGRKRLPHDSSAVLSAESRVVQGEDARYTVRSGAK